MVPHDAREGGPASAAWPGLKVNEPAAAESAASAGATPVWKFISFAAVGACGLAALAVAALVLLRSRVSPPAKAGHAAK